ncbi:MAG: hypothetical protein ACMUHX_00830 [bacterium]
MLSDQDVSEYIRGGITQNIWPIGPDILGYCLEQVWVQNNGNSEAGLHFAIYDSEEAAIRGMYFYTHTTAQVWIWGSLFDGIPGLHAWRSVNDDHAVLFAYGNIGVLISRYRGEDQDMIPVLASAQMEKIDQNLAPEIIQYREILRQSRLSPSDYDKYKAEVLNVDLSGFTKISDGDSLWLMRDEGVKMGIRREWEDEKGRVIGIDICKLESNEMAQEVASERAKMSDGVIVDEPGEIPWNDERSSKIMVHGNTAVHLYYLNHNPSSEESVKKSGLSLAPFNMYAYGYPLYYSSTYYLYPTYTSPYASYSQSFPILFSLSPFNYTPANYLYSAILYNSEPPRFSWSDAGALDYGLLNTINRLDYSYPAIYTRSWRFYTYTGANILDYCLNSYLYDFPLALP